MSERLNGFRGKVEKGLRLISAASLVVLACGGKDNQPSSISANEAQSWDSARSKPAARQANQESLSNLSGPIEITLASGARALCPDPEYVRQNGPTMGMWFSTTGPSLQIYCEGEHGFEQLFPGEEVVQIKIGEVVVDCGKSIDFAQPNCQPVSKNK